MKKIVYIVLAGFLWAFIGISVKLINNEINPFTLNFFRFLTALIFLAILSPIMDKKALKLNRKSIKPYIIIGLLFAVTTSLFVFAVSRTTISNTVLLQAIQPFFIIFIAYFWLKEKITLTKIITLITALIGLYIINPLTTGDLIGNVSAMISGVFFAILTVYMRYTDKRLHHTSTLWFVFFATLFMIPFPFIFGLGKILENIPYILIMGGLGTGLAYFFYNMALERMEADIAGLFGVILIPLFSIILGILVIKESLPLTTIIGGLILISSGVYLKLHSKKIRT